MENTKSDEMFYARKDEVERIVVAVRPYFSSDNEGTLYCNLAHMTKCAFMLGQFPTHPFVQEGRNSFTAKMKMFILSFTDPDRHAFVSAMRELTAVDADEAINDVYSLIQFIDADQPEIKAETMRGIRALMEMSVSHGKAIPAETDAPIWEINGVSTW